MGVRLLGLWVVGGIVTATVASVVLGTMAAITDRNAGESLLHVGASGLALGLTALGLNLMWFVPVLVGAMCGWILFARRVTAIESRRAIMVAGLTLWWALVCGTLFKSIPTALSPESFQMANLAAALILPRLIVAKLGPGAFAAELRRHPTAAA